MKNVCDCELTIKNRYIIIFFIIIFSIIAVSSTQFRFSPTHKIVRQVDCLSCHTDEFDALKRGNHIKMMNNVQNRTLYDYVELYGNVSRPIKSIEGSCYSCHVTYKNFNLFGLTDPYTYTIGKKTYTMENVTTAVDITNAQYGNIITWPEDDKSVIYSGTGNNSSISIELSVLDVSPVNFTVESTVKVVFANYSGQQTRNITCDCTGQNGTMMLNFTDITEDYFKIIVILDGTWNSTLVNLRVNGTDKGTESFSIIANNYPFVYELPFNATGVYYFKTNGTYKAVRLDYVLNEWINYTMENITTSDIIRTRSGNGWINASTCSSPSAMCHINQETTYMGLNDGISPDKSLYAHQMEYTTSKQCDICHLKNKLIVGIDR